MAPKFLHSLACIVVFWPNEISLCYCGPHTIVLCVFVVPMHNYCSILACLLTTLPWVSLLFKLKSNKMLISHLVLILIKQKIKTSCNSYSTCFIGQTNSLWTEFYIFFPSKPTPAHGKTKRRNLHRKIQFNP